MIKPNRILVPTDFSEHSENALRYGCELAQRFGSELHLLYVVDNSPPLMMNQEMTFPIDDLITEHQADAERRLAKLPAAEWNLEVHIVCKVVQGRPFLDIIKYAKDHEIDLIVTGTHGRTGLSHTLLGSVAEKVLRKAPCPVLTVRHPEHEFVKP